LDSPAVRLGRTATGMVFGVSLRFMVCAPFKDWVSRDASNATAKALI
jgi:hypothetical protein